MVWDFDNDVPINVTRTRALIQRALDERGVGVIQFVLCFMLMIEVAALVQTVARSLLQQSIF
jgi:hypothetical protein